MALTETRPETHAPGNEVARAASGILDATDHKAIGRLFIGAGAFLALAGLLVGVVAALEAADLAGFSIAADADEFSQIWSIGRDLLLLGGIVPIFVGLAVYLAPLQVGSPTLVFARGAAAGFWTWLVGTGLLVVSYILNGGPGGGRSDFVELWMLSLIMVLAGLLWTLVCVAATILGARTQGMTLERVPLSTWSFFVFALVGLLALPISIGELIIDFLRLHYGQMPVTESMSLVGVLNGMTLAPAAYWVGVPVLGIGADIIGTHSGAPTRFHKLTMGAIGLFGILTFFPDTVGLASLRSISFDNGLLVVGLLAITLPVLATLALSGDSIRRGSFVARAPMVGALVSGLVLLVATAASLLAQVEPIMGFLDKLLPDQIDMTNTLILNGTVFHEGIRVLAAGAALTAAAAAVSHWGIKIWGRQPAQSMTMVAVLALAGGSVLWALGSIAAGFADQPMLPTVPELSADQYSSLATWGFLAMVGAAVMAVGGLALLGSVATTALGKRSGTGPQDWTGYSLEWAAPSPPPIGNFAGPPVVVSPYPLLDGELVYANAADTVDEGGAPAEGEES